MRSFEFVALNPTGEKRAGTVTAASLSDAKRKIQKKGFYLTSIRLQDSSGHKKYSSFLKELKDFFISKQKIKL